MTDDFPTYSCADCGFERDGSVLTGFHARFTVISPTLIRMEYSESNSFTDQPTFLVMNREWDDVPFDFSVDLGWLTIDTDYLVLRYQIGAPFEEGTLEITWTDNKGKHSWYPGKQDLKNLGGTNWGLDAVGHGDWFPNIYDPEGYDFKQGFLSRNGYCVVDDSKSALWDEDAKWIQARPDDPTRKDLYFFFYGSDYKKFLRDCTRLTGPVPMIPKWALGSWYSRYHPYKDHELKEIVNTYRSKEIPLDVLVIDVDWHLYGWVGYDWNHDYFPDPDGFLKWCKESGLKISLNDHTPDIHGKYTFPVEDSHYAPIVERLGLPSGEPIQLNFEDRSQWEAFRDIVMYPLLDKGCDLWWLDYKGTNREPAPIVNPRTWLAKLFWDATEERKNQRPLVLTRYGDLGAHRYQIGFSGDANSQWNVLDFEVPFTSQAANVVYPYWSHDIGGFHGMWLDPEMYIRWVQFGCFSPILRVHSSKDEHGNGGHRLPWEYGEEVERIIKKYYQLRYRLIPYIYTHCRLTHETAVPLCRPLYLEYPELEEAYNPEWRGEYLFGGSMLVAPITQPAGDENAQKTIYLPEGKWYGFFDGKVYEGPGMVEVDVELEDMPVFVKAGAIIPMQPDMQYVDQKPVDHLTVHVYAGADGSFRLYEDAGSSLEYKNGRFSWTRMNYEESDSDARLLIAPEDGEYTCQPEQRSYEVVFHSLTNPERIYLNGELLDEKTEPENSGWRISNECVVVSVKDMPVDEPVWVVII